MAAPARVLDDGYDLASWPPALREALRIPVQASRQTSLIHGWEYGDKQTERTIRPIHLDEDPAHLLCLGEPRQGKSTLLFLLGIRDILRGKPLVVLEPHADLVRNFIMALLTLQAPGMIIDPAYGFGELEPAILDPFEVPEGRQPQEVIAELLDAFEAIWRQDGSWGHRTRHILQHTFTAMQEAGEDWPLARAPEFMLQPEKRLEALRLVHNADCLRFWLSHVEKMRPGEFRTYVEAPANKIEEFLFLPYVRQMFSKRGSTIHFDRMLNEGITLISLDKDRLKGTQALLGSLILSKIHMATLARRNQSFRTQFSLYIDECYQYWNSRAILDLCAEGAKFGAGVRIFLQSSKYIEELARHDVDKTLDVIRNIIAFNIKSLDAKRIVEDMFRFDAKRVKSATGADIWSWWKPWGNVQRYSVSEERQHAINELTNQAKRECYIRTGNKTYIGTLAEVRLLFHPFEHAYRQAAARAYHGEAPPAPPGMQSVPCNIIMLPPPEPSYWR